MYESMQSEPRVWPEYKSNQDSSAVIAERDVTRALAAQAEALSATPHLLADVWRDLVSRRSRLVDSFTDGERCYAILQEELGETPAPFDSRDRQFLERNLLGESEKVLAYDNDLSISTVAGRLSWSLRTMGLESRASRVPALIAIAVHAFHGATRLAQGQSACFSVGNARLRIVSARRPDSALPGPLTSAERQVIRLLVEGHSHEQMARARCTSPRTIANQLAAAFGKIGVSGRRVLLSHLVKSLDAEAVVTAIAVLESPSGSVGKHAESEGRGLPATHRGSNRALSATVA